MEVSVREGSVIVARNNGRSFTTDRGRGIDSRRQRSQSTGIDFELTVIAGTGQQNLVRRCSWRVGRYSNSSPGWPGKMAGSYSLRLRITGDFGAKGRGTRIDCRFEQPRSTGIGSRNGRLEIHAV